MTISSVYHYTKRDRDVISIGHALGVDAVLDGTIQREGDRARVSVVLIRLSDGKAIWSEKFDQRYLGVFALQDEISERILAAITPNINERIEDRGRFGLTENGEAYRAYLTGLHFWHFRNPENLPKAVHYLEEAVRHDNQFALAHAVLADAYYLASADGYTFLPRSEASQKAVASVARALEIDDSIPEAYLVKAGLALSEMRYEEAEENFRLTITLNPNYASAHLRYGYFLFGEGKLEHAIAEMKLAVDSDPASALSHFGLSYVYFMSRDFENSTRELQKALEFQPDHRSARLNLAEIYIQRQMYKEAQEQLEVLPKTDPYAKRGQAILAAASGDKERASQILNALRTSPDSSIISPYDFGLLYLALGDKNAAIESLQRTRAVRFINACLRFDPQLDELRGDERFANLINRPVPIAYASQ